MTSQEWQEWLESQNVSVTNGTITGADQTASSPKSTTLTLLGHERLLTFSGKENRKFLQGQLTCDVDALTHGEITNGACCNPKGRMVANFRMFAANEDLIASLPADQVEHLKAHLSKYAAFFRTVSITESTNEWVRMGVSGKNASQIISELTGQNTPTANALCLWNMGIVAAISSHASRFELWIKPEHAQTVWQQLSVHATVVNTTQWQLDDMKEGLAWITEASRESWIPQHLNWQAVNGVSFSKGCYTGQEIVARMKYLGKLKSHMYRFTAKLDSPPATGAIVNNSSGKKTGEVVIALPGIQDEIEILAVIRKDDAETGLLTLAENNTPLELKELPYTTTE